MKVAWEPARIAYTQVETEKMGQFVSREVAGAECRLASDHLATRLITPQEVRLPKYDQDGKLKNSGAPPSILVEYKKDGKTGPDRVWQWQPLR